MQSSEAFKIHCTLSTTARHQTSLAVSFDEARKFSQAALAYNRAAALLSSYVRAYAPASPAFRKLAHHERNDVIKTWSALSTHLQNVNARRLVLGAYKSIPSSADSTALVARPATKVSLDDPLVKAIEGEIMDSGAPVKWEDIYGLEDAKKALNEMVVLPALRPDLYRGLRAPGRGILLFGPPGTGKTLIAKAVASNVKATFFSISASSLNSKFHGESERLVRALFQVARERQPSFVFIDEVDSILGSRSNSEHEASRRLKTEFMAQFDGAIGAADDKVYVMAASNRPQDLDDAVRRRLDRRIYVPLPDSIGRREFLGKLIARNEDVRWVVTDSDLGTLARKTQHFSGSDLKALCREASLMPLRELGPRVSQVQASEVRACEMRDFEQALRIVRASSNAKQIQQLETWDREFGSQSRKRESPQAKLHRSLTSDTSTNITTTGTVAVRRPSIPKRSMTTRSMRPNGDSLGSFIFGAKTRK